MILVDTSAWIEFLRKSGHPVHLALKRVLQQRAPIATTEVVIMEVLAGALAGSDHAGLRALLLGLPRVRIKGLPDFEAAADLYRKCCRTGGHGVQADRLLDRSRGDTGRGLVAAQRPRLRRPRAALETQDRARARWVRRKSYSAALQYADQPSTMYANGGTSKRVLQSVEFDAFAPRIRGVLG